MLIQNGFEVYHSNVGWAAGVDQRAGDLKKFILRTLEEKRCEKVNIIAHSMGGLDARHMLFNYRGEGIHAHIASLTTISTPHAGSPFADWGTDHLPHVIPVAGKLGLDLSAFPDLRTDRCGAFNNDPEVVAFEKECEKSLRFQTYAGRQSFWAVFNALKLPFYIIEKEEGANDGLVSVTSAQWRKKYFRGVIENTDHLNELGWWDPAQIFGGESEADLLARIHALYLQIARELP
jgi:triacylglycerol lipase